MQKFKIYQDTKHKKMKQVKSFNTHILEKRPTAFFCVACEEIAPLADDSTENHCFSQDSLQSKLQLKPNCIVIYVCISHSL